MKIIVSIIALLIFISCGKDGTFIPTQQETIYKVEPATQEGYSYEFTKRDCTTGKQDFETFVMACNGLKDESLNSECAIENREELFITSQCPGSFS
ncbi:MAG: hypothetical protein ACJAS4_000657 [Bacteriovoracaceae bacterium]|jgi:hypothetical protein